MHATRVNHVIMHQHALPKPSTNLPFSRTKHPNPLRTHERVPIGQQRDERRRYQDDERPLPRYKLEDNNFPAPHLFDGVD